MGCGTGRNQLGIKSSVVRNLLQGNSVVIPEANLRKPERSHLASLVSSGTYFLSCWMTEARYKQMKAKKVMSDKFAE